MHLHKGYLCKALPSVAEGPAYALRGGPVFNNQPTNSTKKELGENFMGPPKGFYPYFGMVFFRHHIHVLEESAGVWGLGTAKQPPPVCPPPPGSLRRPMLEPTREALVSPMTPTFSAQQPGSLYSYYTPWLSRYLY